MQGYTQFYPIVQINLALLVSVSDTLSVGIGADNISDLVGNTVDKVGIRLGAGAGAGAGADADTGYGRDKQCLLEL